MQDFDDMIEMASFYYDEELYEIEQSDMDFEQKFFEISVRFCSTIESIVNDDEARKKPIGELQELVGIFKKHYLKYLKQKSKFEQ